MNEASKLPIKTEKSGSPSATEGRDWRPFEHLRHEIDRLFDDFGNGGYPFGKSLFRGGFPLFRHATMEMAPAVDIAEKDKTYEITAELPGMDEKDIEVKVSNGVLTIKGEKKEEKEEKKKDYYLSERRYGSFQRTFAVPDGVEADKVEAHFTKGVLTVSLPKSAEAQKQEKTIPVKAG